MQDLGLDFETYWDDDYSLKKMEVAEYVMDPRFEIMGFSTQQPGQKPVWFSGTLEECRNELTKIDWPNTRVVAHNARFDGAILEWRLGIKPGAYLCTMVGSRPHFVPYAGGASLDQIAGYLGLGKKGDFAKNMSGIHRVDMNGTEMLLYTVYCVTDTELAMGIRDRLLPVLPQDEQDMIDQTLKKFLRPKLLLDPDLLKVRLDAMQVEKAAKLEYIHAQYGATLVDIRSRNKFAVILQKHLGSSGVVPKKTNKNGEHTYAFAKDDLGMKALLTHPNVAVRDLAQIKLDCSSTQEESRIIRLLELSKIMGRQLPVPLVYYGAHTGRLSGDHKINLQNLPRVVMNADGTIKKGHLRFALMAQPGYSIVAADLSNIEARLVAVLSRQWDLVDGFRVGRDIYSEFASKIYGVIVHKDTHKKERFVGKTCILGLGYGMGAKKFHLKMLQEGIDMDSRQAQNIVQLYRDTYSHIPALWREIETLAAQHMTNKSAICPWRYGITFAHERIILPNSMPIIYPGLIHTSRGLGFRSRFGKGLLPTDGSDHNNVWGGAFTENLAQALARIILTRAELELAAAGLPAVLQVHDELVYHVPTAIVAQVIMAIEKVITRVVPWMPDLPLAVEINHGPTYGDAK